MMSGSVRFGLLKRSTAKNKANAAAITKIISMVIKIRNVCFNYKWTLEDNIFEIKKQKQKKSEHRIHTRTSNTLAGTMQRFAMIVMNSFSVMH